MPAKGSKSNMERQCCVCFGLKSGVLIFVSLEALFWMFISFVAIFSEVKYIRLTNMEELKESLKRDWYFNRISERSINSFDEQARSECRD
jgi:hypothetical protein